MIETGKDTAGMQCFFFAKDTENVPVTHFLDCREPDVFCVSGRKEDI